MIALVQTLGKEQPTVGINMNRAYTHITERVQPDYFSRVLSLGNGLALDAQTRRPAASFDGGLVS